MTTATSHTSNSSRSPHLEALRADTSNRGRLLLAALDQIDRIGIDNITAADLIGEAGVSRSTLYSYFGEVLGVVAEVWAACGAEWLTQVMTQPERNHDIDAAMVSLLCTARRAPLLNEVVQPDIDAVWASVAEQGEMARMKAAWMLASVVGVELTAPIMPEARGIELLSSLIADMPDDADARVGSLDSLEPLELPETRSPMKSNDDSVTTRLTKAAVEVVASSGLEAASMMRVCRVARLSTGAATPRFAGLRAMHERAFAEANAAVVRSNSEQFADYARRLSPPDMNAMFVRSSLAPNRELWRRYRRELHLAARNDADLAAMMHEAFSESNRALRAAMVRNGAPTSVVDVAVMFNLVFAVGLGAVADTGIPLATFDHRVIIRWLYRHVTGQTPTP